MLSFNCQCSLLSNAEISQNRRIFLWALILILHSKSRFPNICVLFRMDKWLSRQPKVFQNWFYWFFLFLDSCMDYIFIHSSKIQQKNLILNAEENCWVPSAYEELKIQWALVRCNILSNESKMLRWWSCETDRWCIVLSIFLMIFADNHLKVTMIYSNNQLKEDCQEQLLQSKCNLKIIETH